jgi:hypothetical protein
VSAGCFVVKPFFPLTTAAWSAAGTVTSSSSSYTLPARFLVPKQQFNSYMGVHIDVCGSCHVCVLWKEQKQQQKTTKKTTKLLWRMVLCAVSFAGFLVCVCLGLTQLIQCREYRFAVKVSTCNNLPSKKIYLACMPGGGDLADICCSYTGLLCTVAASCMHL